MCICWCVTEINYKMHGATIKICIILCCIINVHDFSIWIINVQRLS